MSTLLCCHLRCCELPHKKTSPHPASFSPFLRTLRTYYCTAYNAPVFNPGFHIVRFHSEESVTARVSVFEELMYHSDCFPMATGARGMGQGRADAVVSDSACIHTFKEYHSNCHAVSTIVLKGHSGFITQQLLSQGFSLMVQ